MRSRIATALFDEPGENQAIAHYEVERRIGAGGMGVVYAAVDTKLERQVAIKRVRRRGWSSRHRQRLIDEARALAKLSHPNVVQVYEVGEHEGDVYVAMELVRGETLWDWAAKPRSVAEILDHYRQAGLGLAAAHAAGIIHRDFKPSNALVGDDGRVRVADFGLALARGEAEVAPTPEASLIDWTSTDALAVGTPGYIAPEILRGRTPDERSDQFSFCVALVEALTQHRPEAGGSLRGHLKRMSWLRRVLARGLASDPQRRWPNMLMLVAALDLPARRQRRWALILVGVGLGVGLAAQAVLTQDANNQCVDPAPRFAEVWNPQRHEAIAYQLEQVGAWTKPVNERLVVALDEQGRQWIDANDQLCTRTQAERRDGAACLDRHLRRVDTLVTSIETSDAAQLALVEDQLALLGDPHTCLTDARRGRPQTELLSTIEAEIDRALLQSAAGEPNAAIVTVDQAIDRARAIDDTVALAEGLLARGRVAYAADDLEGAKQAALAAVIESGRGADDRLATLAACLLVTIYAEGESKTAEARFWLTQAEQARARLGEHELELDLDLSQAHAQHARAAGDMNGATRDLEGALARARAERVATHRIEQIELDLINVLAEQGHSEDALQRYADLRERRVRRLGPAHPEVAIIDFDIGITHADAGELEAAAQALTLALANQRAVFGSGSGRLMQTLAKLAEVEIKVGDVALAEHHAVELLALERVHLRADDPRRLDATALRRFIRAETGDFEGLVALDREMLEALGDDIAAPERGAIHHELAWALCRLGRCEDGRSDLAAATRLGEGLTQMYVELTRAELELSRGEAERARALLDELQAKLDEQADPAGWAEFSWLMAKAEFERDRVRGAELAGVTLERYADLRVPPDIAADLQRMITAGDE